MANVLLVDHQPERLRSYGAMLADLGENLVSASSGKAALSRLAEAEFAVILLAVDMPGLDGFETADLIHQHPQHANTPIIFVPTAQTAELDRRRGRRLEAIEFLCAPVVPQILRSKLAVLCELYRQRQQLSGTPTSADNTTRGHIDLAADLSPQGEPVAARSTAPPAGDAAGQRGRRIMVIDDNQDAANMLAMALRLGEHEVRVVYDPLQAAEACERFRPEVIFMDVSMPGMSGYELALQLRSATWSELTLIIALTGWDDESNRRRSREAGFDHHMVKPADLDEIESLCAARRRPGGGVEKGDNGG